MENYPEHDSILDDNSENINERKGLRIPEISVSSLNITACVHTKHVMMTDLNCF